MCSLHRSLSLFVIGLGLAGCITISEMRNKWVYHCPDGYQFTAEFSRNSEYVEIEADGYSTKLRYTESDAGAQYEDDVAFFRVKGVIADFGTGKSDIHRRCRGDTA